MASKSSRSRPGDGTRRPTSEVADGEGSVPHFHGHRQRLRERFRIAPCSNGNISLMVNLARRNNFAWDAILGAEVARDFKPKPGVYLAACAAFDLAPAQCMMVAAHSNDLAAAAKLSLRTAHIARVNEYGPNTGEAAPTVPVDFAAKNLAELADQFGV